MSAVSPKTPDDYHDEHGAYQTLRRPREDERTNTQKRTFTRWINGILQKNPDLIYKVQDIFSELCDGRVLLDLVEILTGKRIKREKGDSRVHHVNNISHVLRILEENDVKLVSISADGIVDGNQKLILGLLWNLVMTFQVKNVVGGVVLDDGKGSVQLLEGGNYQSTLLTWCQRSTTGYKGVNITDFSSSWASGLAFNALIHSYRPNWFDYDNLLKETPLLRAKHAFSVVQSRLNIQPLLDPEDVCTYHPDPKLVMLYVTSLFEALPQSQVVVEEIIDDTVQLTQASPYASNTSLSQLENCDSVSLEDFQESMELVLSWLLKAEAQLAANPTFPDDQEELKLKIQDHEDFLHDLSEHQTHIQSVLNLGKSLVKEGVVAGLQEFDLRDQMRHLTDKWEMLRRSSIYYQNGLFQKLMTLQRSQLQHLNSWLTWAEERIDRSPPVIGSSLEEVGNQLAQHKSFQASLEAEQSKVNALGHMMVVLGENDTEDSTVDLEEMLRLLGERWAAVCRWSEQRGMALMDAQHSWVTYYADQDRLNAWLQQKDSALSALEHPDLTSKDAVNAHINKIRLLHDELAAQLATFGDFNDAAQTVAQILDDNSEGILAIQQVMGEFNTRWNTLTTRLNKMRAMMVSVENDVRETVGDMNETTGWICEANTQLDLFESHGASESSSDLELVESLDAAMRWRGGHIQQKVQKVKDLSRTLTSEGFSDGGLLELGLSLASSWEALRGRFLHAQASLEVKRKQARFQGEGKVLLGQMSSSTKVLGSHIQALAPSESAPVEESKRSLEERERVFAESQLSVETVGPEVLNTMDRLRQPREELHQQDTNRVQTQQSSLVYSLLENVSHLRLSLAELEGDIPTEVAYSDESGLASLLESLKGLCDKHKSIEAEIDALKSQVTQLKGSGDAANLLTAVASVESGSHVLKVKLLSSTENCFQRLSKVREYSKMIRETLKWTNDVKGFLHDMEGLLVESDLVSLVAQLKEVEALELDIQTVSSKVNLLRQLGDEINRKLPDGHSFARKIADDFASLDDSWTQITSETPKNKLMLTRYRDLLSEHGPQLSKLSDEVLLQETQVLTQVARPVDPAHAEMDLHDSESRMTSLEDLKAQLGCLADQFKGYPGDCSFIVQLQKTTSRLTSVSELLRDWIGNLNHMSELISRIRDILLRLERLQNQLKTVVTDANRTAAYGLENGAVMQMERDFHEEVKGLQIEMESELGKAKVSPLDKIALGSMQLIFDRTIGECRQLLLKANELQSVVKGVSCSIVSTEAATVKDELLLFPGLSGLAVEGSQQCPTYQDEPVLKQVRTALEAAFKSDPHTYVDGYLGLKQDAGPAAAPSPQDPAESKQLEDLAFQLTKFQNSSAQLLHSVEAVTLECADCEVISSDLHLLESLEQRLNEMSVQVDRLQVLSSQRTTSSSFVETSVLQQTRKAREDIVILQSSIQEKKKLFTLASERISSLQDSMYTLSSTLKRINLSLQAVQFDSLPPNPEQLILSLKAIERELFNLEDQFNNLREDCRGLLLMSNSQSFVALEMKMIDLVAVYSELNKEVRERSDILNSWKVELDQYERQVDQFNSWLDSAEKSLSIISWNLNAINSVDLSKIELLGTELQTKTTVLSDIITAGSSLNIRCSQPVVSHYMQPLRQRWSSFTTELERVRLAARAKVSSGNNPDWGVVQEVITTQQVPSVEASPTMAKVIFIERVETIITEVRRILDVIEKHEYHLIIGTKSPRGPSADTDESTVKRRIEDLKRELASLRSEQGLFSDSASSSYFSDLDEKLVKIGHQLEVCEEKLHMEMGKSEEVAIEHRQVQDKLKEVESWLLQCDTSTSKISEYDLVQRIMQVDALLKLSEKGDRLGRSSSFDLPRIKLLELKKRLCTIQTEFYQLNRVTPLNRSTTYYISVYTGNQPGSGTSSQVSIKLFFSTKIPQHPSALQSESILLSKSETNPKAFSRDQVDLFIVPNQPVLGDGRLTKVRVLHDNSGPDSAWYVGSIVVYDSVSGLVFLFSGNCWIGKEKSILLRDISLSGWTLMKLLDVDVLRQKGNLELVSWIVDDSTKTAVDQHVEQTRLQLIVREIRLVSEKLDDIQADLNELSRPVKEERDVDMKNNLLEDVRSSLTEISSAVERLVETKPSAIADSSELVQAVRDLKNKYELVNSDVKRQTDQLQTIVPATAELYRQSKELGFKVSEAENLLLSLKQTRHETGERTMQNKIQVLESLILEITTTYTLMQTTYSSITNQNLPGLAEQMGPRVTQFKRRIEGLSSEMADVQSSMFRDDLEVFEKSVKEMESWLVEVEKSMSMVEQNNPDLLSFEGNLMRLKQYESELSEKSSTIHRLVSDSQRVQLNPAVSAEQRYRLTALITQLQRHFQSVSTYLPKVLISEQDHVQSAARLLEEITEIKVWMAATRRLVEGKLASSSDLVHLDAEAMRISVLDKQGAINKINDAIKPANLAGSSLMKSLAGKLKDQVDTLNTDWAALLKMSEGLQTVEPAFRITSENLQNSANVDRGQFDLLVSDMHEWLKAQDKRITTLRLIIGSSNNINQVSTQIQTIKSEMATKKMSLEDVVEAGAALNMNLESEAERFLVDEKLSRLKDFWSLVYSRVDIWKSRIDFLNMEWNHFITTRGKLQDCIEKADNYLEEQEREVFSSVSELEDQVTKHKAFQSELSSWMDMFQGFKTVGEALLTHFSDQDITEVKNSFEDTCRRWKAAVSRSSSLEKKLAIKHTQLKKFHADMITALSWLSAIEYNVADLDEKVEKCALDEQSDPRQTAMVLQSLEDDINSHQVMFRAIFETGNLLVRDLDTGDTKTALRAKLDDLTDRWNMLNFRLVDVREKMHSGSAEWRQMLDDLTELLAWLATMDHDLNALSRVGGDLETLQRQMDFIQTLSARCNAQRPQLEALVTQAYLAWAQKEKLIPEDMNKKRSSQHIVAGNVSESVKKQVDQINVEWKEVCSRLSYASGNIETSHRKMLLLYQQMEDCNHCITNAEQDKSMWMNSARRNLGREQQEIEIKTFGDLVDSIERILTANDALVQDLKSSHHVEASQLITARMESLRQRWRQLQIDLAGRRKATGEPSMDPQLSNNLSASVDLPWERSVAANLVPYYINHVTKQTCWEHPAMAEALKRLATEVDTIQFSAYRTAVKLRHLQKLTNMDQVPQSLLVDAFAQHGIRMAEPYVTVPRVAAMLLSIFSVVDKGSPGTIKVPLSADLTLNWLMNMFDSARVGKMRPFSVIVALVLVCKEHLETKYQYIYLRVSDELGQCDEHRLSTLLTEILHMPKSVGESNSFSPSSVEPLTKSCFEMARTQDHVNQSLFIKWIEMEPQTLVWVPVLHRLVMSESAKHDTKCTICKQFPIVGLRFRCLKCFNYDLCQMCFFTGKVSRRHRLTHPIHQYCLAATAGEDVSDFLQLVGNKFKTRRYRSRPSKKLSYLPVSGGSSTRANSISASSNQDIHSTMGMYTDRLSELESERGSQFSFDDDEHTLIRKMCRSLSDAGQAGNGVNQHPAYSLNGMEMQTRIQMEKTIRTLRSELSALVDEYNHLNRYSGDHQDANGERSVNAASQLQTSDLAETDEARLLRQHRDLVESRISALEQQTRQIEIQLQRLRSVTSQAGSSASLPVRNGFGATA